VSSFPPEVPTPASRRGRDLASQRADDARGRFYEKLHTYDFGAVGAGAKVDARLQVPSLGGRFVRLVAWRGDTENGGPSYLGRLVRVGLMVNAEHLIAGAPANNASFATLFGYDPKKSPWFWFASPPRLRAGDTLVARITNANDSATVIPNVALRLVDEDWWFDAYASDRDNDLEANEREADGLALVDGRELVDDDGQEDA